MASIEAGRDRNGGITRRRRAMMLILVGLASITCRAEIAVIPNPLQARPGNGEFVLTPDTVVLLPARDAGARVAADYLVSLLAQKRMPRLVVRAGGTGAGQQRAIVFSRAAPPVAQGEHYVLEATPERITITAAGDAGLFYAAVTLWQLVQQSEQGNASIGAVRIDDGPRYAWRGLMLDSARHYQSPAFIEQLLDWMAIHKLNVLQWHLTDDQGWRLEIRSHPRLTTVGAWRVPAGAAAQADVDPATGRPRLYGGFYSQRTVRRLVAYASARHISIVPEIDMPGHASAALAAYPELGVAPLHLAEVPARWGVYPHVYNTEPATIRFLEDVLREVTNLFPSRYVHLGGDEVVTDEWRDSPATMRRLKTLGLHDVKEIPGFFMAHMERFLAASGRQIVGWDEILTPTLSKTATVMSWRGSDGAVAAALRGNDTILAPGPTLYLDNRQSDAPWEPPGRGKVISLAEVYGFEPQPAALERRAAGHVLGVQASLWTEHIRTEERQAWMSFPRAAAVAELGWSDPERRDFRDFLRRLAVLWPKYAMLRLAAADSVFAPRIDGRYLDGGRTVEVAMENQEHFGTVHYSVDGSEPSALSPVAKEPMVLALPVHVAAGTFVDAQPLAVTRHRDFSEQLAQRRSSQELRLCSEHLALNLEDDAPVEGPRAIFYLDLMNPCWIYQAARLDRVNGIDAAVGQVPFNFEIGADRDRIHLPVPTTPAGELEVHVDGCDGEIWVRLPLAPAAASEATTVLSAIAPPRTGVHDLCLRFAQRGIDPLWALAWFGLNAPPAVTESR
jgi:hexosaminidase